MKEDLGIYGRIISELILKESTWEGLDWIGLDQDRDKW
jgi:hypothetical protein